VLILEDWLGAGNIRFVREAWAHRDSGAGGGAPLAVIRGRHRWRLLVKAPREIDVQDYLRARLAALPPSKGDIRLTVDVGPYSFL
jgi:primosomal protein N'